MSETVVFSQLSRKFIDENDATPDQAQQVVYYSSWRLATTRRHRLSGGGAELPVGRVSGMDRHP